MKLIPVIGRRPGGRRARRLPPFAAITASLALLAPLSLPAPALASTALASTALAGTAHPGSAAAAAAGQAANPSCPWLNQSLPISQRVQLLLSKMTLANEITMVEGQGTAQPYVFYMAAQPSLCIPAIGLEDGPLGVGDGLTGVTQLPSGASLAATFDTSLASRYGAVIGQEEWGKGAAVNLGPTVNILRDPRWGRSFEAFTEDPFLNAALAVHEIGGVQAQGEMSQVKHFAAYNQETNRNTPADDVIVSNRTLHEIYLPAFEQAVTQAKVASVMCAYSVINGNFACQNPYLETRVLKQRWGFPGFVTSDYTALHSTQGAVDGTDMEQPFNIYFGAALQADVENGTIPRSVVDNMVSRIATEMFRFGIFNHPPTGTTSASVTTPAHQAVSEHVAEEGTVLLKNDGGVLPLPAGRAGTVAVIGPAASAAPTPTGGGSAFVTAPFSVTPLQGLQAAAGPGTSVVYQQGLPTDTSLPAIPAPALSPAYAPTPLGGSYTGTLTAPETGTYVLAITNPCGCYNATTLSLDGTEILSNPSTPPVHTYSAAVQLQAGHTYQIQISGNSSALTWATPSALAPGISQAAATARSARVAVVVVSDDTETEAADRPDLSLPSAQDELISAVAAANPHTVVVIDAGAPVAMPWLGQVAAVVDAWYPGESNGTALASVLYGATDPSGHLPVTFPQSLSQVPASTPAQFPGVGGKVLYSEGIDVGYRWYDARNLTPLFPFGYGLSYTSFAFSDLRVTPPQLAGRGALVKVTARVTNTGRVAGSEVAQLYLGDPAAAGEPPRQLKGFQRVALGPGQSGVVSFTLDAHDLSYWNDAANGWVVPPGGFRIYVGDSSALSGLPLRGGFTVTGGG
jgi:beta-glucosidase